MDLASVAVAATPLWEQLLVAGVGGLAGGLVGGGLALLAAMRSLDKAARHSLDERTAQYEADRRAAILAVAWELEIGQQLLEETAGQHIPPALTQVALDAGMRWYGNLPDTARLAVKEAQSWVVRYNAAVRHLSAVAVGSYNQTAFGSAARNAVGEANTKTIQAFAQARNALTQIKGLGL